MLLNTYMVANLPARLFSVCCRFKKTPLLCFFFRLLFRLQFSLMTFLIPIVFFFRPYSLSAQTLVSLSPFRLSFDELDDYAIKHMYQTTSSFRGLPPSGS